MNKFKSILFLLVVFVISNCGTGIGNGIYDPTTSNGSYTPQQLDFSVPVHEYKQNSELANCGSFTEDSTISEIDVGRECVHHAFKYCIESVYLYDKENTDGSRFVSFVSVVKIVNASPGRSCQIHVHTVSDVPPPIGDQEATCYTLGLDELPELACGIAN